MPRHWAYRWIRPKSSLPTRSTSGARSNRTVVRTSLVSFSLRVLNVAECHFQPA